MGLFHNSTHGIKRSCSGMGTTSTLDGVDGTSYALIIPLVQETEQIKDQVVVQDSAIRVNDIMLEVPLGCSVMYMPIMYQHEE